MQGVETDRIPFTDYKKHFKLIAKSNMHDSLLEAAKAKGTEYFSTYYNSSTKPWYYNKSLPREIVSTVNRCRSGHYQLASSLARIQIVSTPSCICGHDFEDVNHILWQCPRFDMQRQELLKQLRKVKLFLPLSCCMILREPNIKICNILHSFLKKCNLQL